MTKIANNIRSDSVSDNQSKYRGPERRTGKPFVFDTEDVRQVIKDCLPADHWEDHSFIRELVDEMKAKRERRARIKERVIGSVILSGILGILTFFGKFVYDLFHHIPKN